MTFTSDQFWVFLAGVFALYWLAREKRWQNIILLTASYIFYGWVQPWLALMLGISTLADYFLAKGIKESSTHKRSLMAASLILNLGVLAFFKYYNFFRDDLVNFINTFGMQVDFFAASILLPVGLSFYTLKKLGYMIDVSRGTLQPTDSLIDFALYVSFFPQIAAGPIDRPQKLLPQIKATRVWKTGYFYSAWPLILMGLFKKIVIANSVSVLTNRIFHLEEPNLLLATTGALMFTLQILADFSAYTDLSRGVSFLLGFETSENFKSPYLSLTPTDFWNRWHITLSTWLRDYIFFPTRRWLLRRQGYLPTWLVQAAPPLVTMLTCGLWHGAGWTYIIWGGMYGILIPVYQAIGMGGNWKPTSRIKVFLAWFVMFSFVVFGWMLFAAPSLNWVVKILSNPIAGSVEQQAVALIGLSITLVYSIPMVVNVLLERFTRSDSFIRTLYYAVATVMILIYTNSSASDFIYFQF
jgi:D-alanyl-lipoteichoic acid acyltransferase DltB (MBOAT superfamily)